MMRASAVSLPIRLACIRKLPVLFSVPPITSSPLPFSTGIGSPVSMDSSTLDCPSKITPSTGIFSPGRTRTVSSSPTSSIGTSSSLPLRMIRAVRGCRPIRRLIASEVLPRARISSAAPRLMSAMMTMAASK